jgi:hypothetical protein
MCKYTLLLFRLKGFDIAIWEISLINNEIFIVLTLTTTARILNALKRKQIEKAYKVKVSNTVTLLRLNVNFLSLNMFRSGSIE